MIMIRLILCAFLILLPTATSQLTALPDGSPLNRENLRQAVEKAGFHVVSMAIDALDPSPPTVDFAYLPVGSPWLLSLEKTYDLQGIIQDVKDEWTAQLLLKDWVHGRLPGGTPSSSPSNAMEILRRAATGETFWCTYYMITYVECAQALGWQARRIAVDRRHGPESLGSTHHGVAEVWSNQFRKWVVIDAQSNLHFEKKGVPLSAWEIRHEWLGNQGREVDHVVGAPPNTIRRNPAMVWAVPDADEIATYYWLYIETQSFSGEKSSKKILLFDKFNADDIWYQNDDELHQSQLHVGYLKNQFLPTRNLEEAYWTVCAPEIRLSSGARGSVTLGLDSYCPNFLAYEVLTGDGPWQQLSEDRFRWNLLQGWNSIRLRTRNQAGVAGPLATILLYLDATTD